MATNNVDLIADGTYLRFENGRAVEGRKVFQRTYSGGLDAFGAVKNDNTLPIVGDRFSSDYPDLACISADITHRSQNEDGASALRIVAEFIDQGRVHIEGGSATATVLTSFDRQGNRLEVAYDGETYIAQVEYEEPRGYMLIELHKTFEGSATMAQYVRANLNKVNSADFEGLPPRCWRISKIDYQLVRDWFQGVQRKAYRITFYVESLPPKLAELVPNEPKTLVPGWDKIVGFEQEGGIIPADAIFQVEELYDAAEFGGETGIFAGVNL